MLEGARRCFARHGYEGATVVPPPSGRPLPRSIFNWFGSKHGSSSLAARDNRRLLNLFAEEGLEALLDALLRDDPDTARRLPRVR